MAEIWCVRAVYGKYAQQFLEGAYIAIGWLDKVDLSDVNSREQVWNLYVDYYKEDTSSYVIGQQVGQISRFLHEIKPGDYVITMPENTNIIYWGIVEDKPYYFSDTKDGCPFPHRRKVKWHNEPVLRANFSVPFQNSIRSSLTVFWVKHKNNFFEVIGKKDLIPYQEFKTSESNYDTVLNRLMELDATEFELLVTHILTALGFEAEHTGKVGDGGVDATGELDINNLAKIKLFVQVKRYDINKKISDAQVKDLRKNIPYGGQGAFITTCDFTEKALEIATDPQFPRIGTMNGKQLVDVLVQQWNEIPTDFKEKLGLKKGLILE